MLFSYEFPVGSLLCRSSMEVCNGLTCLDLLVNYIEVNFFDVWFRIYFFDMYYIFFLSLYSKHVHYHRFQSLNSKYGCNIPLLLMNKGDTNDAILKVTRVFNLSFVFVLHFQKLIVAPCFMQVLENHSNTNLHTVVQVCFLKYIIIPQNLYIPVSSNGRHVIQVPSHRETDLEFEPTSSEERNSDSELYVQILINFFFNIQFRF